MAKYTNMVKQNKLRSEEMTTRTLSLINEMYEDGEKIQICTLQKRLGYSREFFYKNTVVHEAIVSAMQKQTGTYFGGFKKIILDEAKDSHIKRLREENAHMKIVINRLLDEKNAQNDADYDFIENL